MDAKTLRKLSAAILLITTASSVLDDFEQVIEKYKFLNH